MSDVSGCGLDRRRGARQSHGLLSLNGTAGLTFSAGDGTNDASMTFAGTTTDVNSALDGLTFIPAIGYSGAATVTVAIDDLGNSGTGGSQTDSAAVAVTVGSSTRTFQQGTSGYFGTEDTELRETNPATAQGNNTSISIDLDKYLAVGESATDTFTYTVSDGNGGTDTATVTITITGVNDTPVGSGDHYNVDSDDTLVVAAPGVIANDTDIDGDPLAAVLVSGPSRGTLTINLDGSFVNSNVNFEGFANPGSRFIPRNRSQHPNGY